MNEFGSSILGEPTRCLDVEKTTNECYAVIRSLMR